MPIDIKIKELSYEPNNGIIGSKLSLSYSGSDINNKIVNTIRRVTLNDIPTYAFPSELIKISKNDSVFTNDYMRDHLTQLPILDIHSDENELFFLHPKYWEKVDYNDETREIHESEINISLYVNVKNDSQNIISVTTNDATIMKGDEKINMFNKKYPPLIIQLKPGQSFVCSMRSSLGIGEKSDIWAASANSYFDVDEKDNSIVGMYESAGQLDEYEYLIKACDFILYKLEQLKLDIQEQFTSAKLNKNQKQIFIVLNNEDHTMGELINNALQDLPEVLYSGFCKPDGYIKEGIIKLICTSGTCLEAFNKVIDNLENTFRHIKPLYVKLYSKHQTTDKKANKKK